MSRPFCGSAGSPASRLPTVTRRSFPAFRGTQPSEDRVAIEAWGKKLDRLREVATTMGHILAWDQLRAAGRSGSARADELIAFAQRDDWATEMLDTAIEMTRITQHQWKIFKEALGRRA
jgi:hypothetical protein